jgi:hypothetical protein
MVRVERHAPKVATARLAGLVEALLMRVVAPLAECLEVGGIEAQVGPLNDRLDMVDDLRPL